jgi:flavin reductase (DIM6/NTAB) family NADH-FMN oxidoreductase RutF
MHKTINPNEISDNIVQLMGTDWTLLTAGEPGNFNSMTAAWGGMGFLWNKPVAFILVRPVRHTFGFMEKYPNFSLSFFPEEFRETLKILGSKSGRDIDKINYPGLTPSLSEHGTIQFAESRLHIDCKKIYVQNLDPEQFMDPTIHKLYPNKDYHRVYWGEITGVSINL